MERVNGHRNHPRNRLRDQPMCFFPFIEYYKPFTQYSVKTQDLLFLYYRFYISMDLSDEKYTKCKLEECINVDFFIKVLEFCTRVDLRGSGVFCRVLPGFLDYKMLKHGTM